MASFGRRALFGGVLAGGAVLFGLFAPRVQEGTVIRKHHEPGRWRRGRRGRRRYDDPDWVLTVQGIDQYGGNHTGRVEVSEAEYNRAAIGSYWRRR